MSIKLNGYTIPDETINQMKVTIEESKQINSELGFTLCTDQKGNINARNICTGKGCQIEIKSKCEDKEKFVGTYHTHPNAPSTASANDLIKCGATRNTCIGGADNRTTCYIWKHEPVTHDRYSEFINILHEGIEKIDDPINGNSFECIKELGIPAYIEREMPEINKKIDEQQRELQSAKQEKVAQNIIDEMEKVININLEYRSKITAETLEKIEELTPKYYKKQILW